MAPWWREGSLGGDPSSWRCLALPGLCAHGDAGSASAAGPSCLHTSGPPASRRAPSRSGARSMCTLPPVPMSTPSRHPSFTRRAPGPTPAGLDHPFLSGRQRTALSLSTPRPYIPCENIRVDNVFINYKNHLCILSSNQTFTQKMYARFMYSTINCIHDRCTFFLFIASIVSSTWSDGLPKNVSTPRVSKIAL